MIEVRTFDMGSGTFGNCPEFLHTGLPPAVWQTLKAFSQGFDHICDHVCDFTIVARPCLPVLAKPWGENGRKQSLTR